MNGQCHSGYYCDESYQIQYRYIQSADRQQIQRNFVFIVIVQSSASKCQENRNLMTMLLAFK